MAGLPFQGFQSERHSQGEEYQASEVDQGRGERVLPPLHGLPVPAWSVLDDQLQGIRRVSEIGDRVVRSYPLVDIDEINLPSLVKPYTQMNINGYGIATDLFSFLTSVPHADCVVFNQVVQIPNQRKLLRKLQAKAKRHGSMPDPSNKIAKEDIEEVLDRLAVDSTQLVYCNFNILVSCPADKVTPVTSYLETKLYECGIMPSRTAYNQLELFTDSFPGNGYAFNPDYDLFLTLSDAALCFFSRNI